MMRTKLPWAKIVICAVALFAGLGGFFADFSDTHILNPLWPPHAKFHNAQTMSIGLLLAALTLVFAVWKTDAPRLQLVATAVLGSLYWTSIVCAQFFPGVGLYDPQFADREKIMVLGVRLTQPGMGLALVILVCVMVALELGPFGRRAGSVPSRDDSGAK